MNLLEIGSKETLTNYLLGGSVPIMGVFLTMLGLDLTTGYVKATRSVLFWKTPMTSV